MSDSNSRWTRRRLLGAAALPGIFRMAQGAACAQKLNRNSAPSQLKITDMRSVLVASNYDYPIIRIDTNQGVYGLGEAARRGAAKARRWCLKPHIMGRNSAAD